MNNILLATEEDRQQILDLYEEQKGREFCPWDGEDHELFWGPNGEIVD